MKFSRLSLKVRRQWNDIFQVLRENLLNSYFQKQRNIDQDEHKEEDSFLLSQHYKRYSNQSFRKKRKKQTQSNKIQ